MLPPVLLNFGLAPAIEDLTDKISMPNLNVEASVYGLEDRLEEHVELALYRSITELVDNILKYAEATEISIQLTDHEHELNIIVADNGIGFNYDPQNPNYGIGLKNIHSRVKYFGGNMDIDTVSGNGCTINISVPLTDIKIEDVSQKL